MTPTILIDTREQTPLRFEGYPVEVAGLPVGDYGVKGFSDWNNPAIIFERKSLGDLIGSLTSGRPRFLRGVEKMRQFRFRALVIEATFAEVEAGAFRSKATPQSLIASLYALQVRCGLHVLWAGGSAGAAKAIEGMVRQFVRGVEKDYKRLQGPSAGPCLQQKQGAA